MKQFLINIVDLFIIYGSILLAFKILDSNDFLTAYQINFHAFYAIAPLIGVMYLIFMYAFGLYNSTRRSLSDVIYTVFLISISLMMGIMALCFFVRGGAMAFPRSVILLSAFLYCILLVLWRSLVWKTVRVKHGRKGVLVVGPQAVSLAQTLKKKYHHLYDIRFLCEENDPKLMDYITKSDDVYVTSGVCEKIREKILLAAANQKTGVYFVPGYSDISIFFSSMLKTDDIPTFCTSQMELTPEERMVKRAVDLIFGTIGFLIALPLGLVTAFLVKLDGGPIFYSQERLTRNNKSFKVYKFRTMVPDAEKLSGPVLAGEDDPRITKIGRFMRATRLDEIPQILNILSGDMSIVGPRPERPFFTNQFEESLPWYTQRLKVKAGLTGLAQVEGKYNTSVENKLRYDLIYINNYSLFQDLMIILRTVKILFLKESTEGVEEKEENPNIKIEKSFY